MAVKKKILASEDEIETLDDENLKKSKEKSNIKWNVFLIISILLLSLAAGTFGYIFHENQKLNDEINSSKDNIKKIEENLINDQKEITEKENEYEKLKEKVKDNLEELKTWEELKEELNKSLS